MGEEIQYRTNLAGEERTGMIELHLYGDLGRHARDSRADGESIVQVRQSERCWRELGSTGTRSATSSSTVPY